MAQKKKSLVSPIVKKLTVTFYPWELKIGYFTCKSTEPTISDQDRKSIIENHIDKYSQAWEELAKR